MRLSMHRLLPVARRVASVALAVPLMVACGAGEALPPPPPPPPVAPPLSPPPPQATPLASASPSGTPARAATAAADAGASRVFRGVDMSAWDKDWPKGWTDPRVVAGLAESCDFAPVGPDSDVGPDTEANVFACGLFFEQACIVTPCASAEVDCKHHCEETCSACTAGCTHQCSSCEAACADMACKKACAAATGACKDGCTRTLDRCGSATCTQAFQRCSGSQGTRAR